MWGGIGALSTISVHNFVTSKTLMFKLSLVQLSAVVVSVVLASTGAGNAILVVAAKLDSPWWDSPDMATSLVSPVVPASVDAVPTTWDGKGYVLRFWLN